jgi:hypothetical protein
MRYMRQNIAQEVHAAALPQCGCSKKAVIATLSPSCASLTTSGTPCSPRATSDRRKPNQLSRLSVSTTSMPMTSRGPRSLTP